MADKEKVAALILSRRKPSAPSEDAGPSDEESAAEELIAAVKDGDAKGVVEAFKALYDTCDTDEGA